MASRIFLTGGSGFVGGAILQELLDRHYTIVALQHHRKPVTPDDHPRIIPFDEDNDDQAILSTCSAAIHLIGIINERPKAGITFEKVHVERTRQILSLSKAAGIPRFIHMSALGARPSAPSAYHQTKWQAEELVRASGMDWTIFRPSMIHGPHGEFMRMEAKWARGKAPPCFFMPYFGAGPFGLGGAGKIQPLYVRDVARAFVDAIDKPQAIGQIYEIGGPRVMSWPEMHHIAARAIIGHDRLTLPVPAWCAKLLTHVVPRALLPFNRDQVLMSQEDNTCDLTKFQQDFGWEPADFAASLSAYAHAL